MSLLPLPHPIWHPRSTAILTPILDDQIPGGPGLPGFPFQAVPVNATWKNNSARRADEATLEFDYRDFPFDPRLLKAVHVALHAEDALDPSVPMIPSRSNLRFVGNVTVPETHWGPGGESVRFTCQDYTGIYLSKDWRQAATPIPVPRPGAAPAYGVATPIGLPLIAIIEQIRQKITPDTAPVIPHPLDPSVSAAIPNAASGREWFRVSPEKDKFGGPVSSNAWDVICGLCDQHALVPMWNLDVLEVRSAATKGRGQAVMIYGHNVQDLTFRRNLGTKADTKPVQLVCWNSKAGTTMFSLPEPATALTPKLTSKTGKPTAETVEVKQYHVEGAYTPPELQLMAKRVYAESAKGQLEGELVTHSMADATLLAPLLGLRNGDRLVCALSPDVSASINGMSYGEAVLFLTNPTRGGAPMNPAMATLLVDAAAKAKALSSTFYVNEVEHSISRDNGYQCKIKFNDFILGF